MLEFFHDFLYDKETFANVVMPIILIAVFIAFWIFVDWLFRD